MLVEKEERFQTDAAAEERNRRQQDRQQKQLKLDLKRQVEQIRYVKVYLVVISFRHLNYQRDRYRWAVNRDQELREQKTLQFKRDHSRCGMSRCDIFELLKRDDLISCNSVNYNPITMVESGGRQSSGRGGQLDANNNVS